MGLNCTRCQGSGFLNIEQVPEEICKKFDDLGDHGIIEKWIKDNEDHDVSVCDCCGDMESWYDIPGEHYNSNDPQGRAGPYSYNGGLCECH